MRHVGKESALVESCGFDDMPAFLLEHDAAASRMPRRVIVSILLFVLFIAKNFMLKSRFKFTNSAHIGQIDL